MLTTEEFSGEEILIDSGESVADQVERRILLDKLKQAMGALSDAEQLLVYRHYFAGMSETELAAIYGISQQAVSKRIRSIRGKLKKSLEK